MTVRQPLGKIGGESVTIPAGSLSKLAAQDGVDYVTLDADVEPTGGVTGAARRRRNSSTDYPLVDGAVEGLEEGLRRARTSASQSSTAA